MPENTLAWRIEEVCHNAWPSPRQVLMGDWLLRFAAGVSRRGNSANPLRPEARCDDALLASCRALYRAQGLPTLFRIPFLVDPAVDRFLEAGGYTAEGETVTLHGAMAGVEQGRDAAVALLPRPDEAWLEAIGRLQGQTPERNRAYRQVVDLIVVPAAFCALRQDGRPVALAYGAVHDGLLCFESVVTDKDHRGKGYGRRVLRTLAAWGAANGAGAACLQVEAANAPARALYARLGLKTELYRYHYRRAPHGG